MVGPPDPKFLPAKARPPGPTRRTALGLVLGAPLLAACSGVQQRLRTFGSPGGPPLAFFLGPPLLAACSGVQQSLSTFGSPAGPPQQPQAVGNGGVKVG